MESSFCYLTLVLLCVSLQTVVVPINARILTCRSDLPFDCSTNNGVCVAERAESFVNPGQPVTLYYCLDKNRNPHWRQSCNGDFDTDTNVVQCCIEDLCNAQLMPRWPNETQVPTVYPPYRPTPSTTEAPTLSTTLPTINETITTADLANDTLTTNANDDTANTTTDLYTHTPSTDISTTSSEPAQTLLKCRSETEGVPLNGHPGFCHGTMCFIERFPNGRHWGCLDDNSPFNISEWCNQPATSSRVVACCNHGDQCNILIHPEFPTQRPSPLPPDTPSNTLSSNGPTGGEPVDPILVVTIVLAIIGLSLLILITSILLYLFWRHYSKTKVVSQFNTPCASPTSETASSGSSVPNLDTHTDVNACSSLA